LKTEPSLKNTGPAPTEIAKPRAEANASASARKRLTGLIAFVILLVAAFIGPLVSLAIHAAGSKLHSHILLVPLITAYLLSIRRDKLPKEYDSSAGWTLVALLAGLAALFGAWTERGDLSHNDYLAVMVFSFLCLLAAGGFFLLGRKWMAAAAFPMFFLVFMVPMPDAMADTLETASKLASTEAASLFFDMSGTPVLRDGVIFQLPNITIRVAQECSGIRSSWVLVITSLLAANLFLSSTWRRAVLVCFVIPLGIVRNGFRIWVIGVLCVKIGPRMINSLIHHRGGPIFFVLSLIPLFLLLWWLRRSEAIARNN
jgi:exosortase C (VPDSG-CTERM-specific)